MATALLVLSLVGAAFIDFPPGDSWTHGWTVERWLQADFVLNDWSSAVALPQQILGWIVHVGASSVQWARLSVLTALVTVSGCLIAAWLPVVLYPMRPPLKDWAPLFVVVCFAPTFTLKVAAGFMTDAYYLLLLTAALWMLLSAVSDSGRQSNAVWVGRWVGFAALGTLAALQRTHGLTLLFIVGAWVLLARVLPLGGKRERNWLGWRGWFPVLTCAVGLALALAVLAIPQLHPARSGEVTAEMRAFWAGRVMPWDNLIFDRTKLIFGVLQHLGLVLLPIALIGRLHLGAIEKSHEKHRINWWYVGLGTAFLLLVFVLWGNASELFPYLGNSLTAEGFGPRSDTIALTAGHVLNPAIRVILTVLGSIGGLTLIWLLSRTVKLRAVDWRSPATLIGLLGVAHLALVLLNPNFFDRYLLPLIPFCLCWLAPAVKDVPAKARLGAWALVAVFLVWGVWGTADALNWSKAKWDLAAEAHEKGIPSSQIVAGYEPDGFYNYTNESYPGLDFVSHPGRPWWVDRLGLPITPYFVILEEGAQVEGTSWEGYEPTDIVNDRMRVWAYLDILEAGEEVGGFP